MDSFAKARSLIQGILLLVVSPIGILGLLAMMESGNTLLGIMFGVVTPLCVVLGIWLIWRSRASK